MLILLSRAHRTQTNSKMTSSLSSASSTSSGPAPTAFKLLFSGETRRFVAPRSWNDLQVQANALWGSHPYVFTYT